MRYIKENEIIGYEVPFSLCYGAYKAGDVVLKTYFGYAVNGSIPNEIIETWKPIFAKHDIYIYPLRLRQLGEDREIVYVYISKNGIEVNKTFLNNSVLKEIATTKFPKTDFLECEEVCVSNPNLFGTPGNYWYLNIYDVKEMYKILLTLKK